MHSIRFRINCGPDTDTPFPYIEFSQGQILQESKEQEMSTQFMTHRPTMMYPPLKFHEYFAYGLRVISWTSLHARTQGHGIFQMPLRYSLNRWGIKKASCVQMIKDNC